MPNNDRLFPIGENRDERILVEYQGIMHAECEEVFYGLEHVPKSPRAPFKRREELLEMDDPVGIYNEICFFRPRTLLDYLNYGETLPPPICDSILELCKLRYDFNPSTITSFCGAMVNLIQADFVKSVTFVFNSTNNVKDLRFLQDMLGEEVLQSKAFTIACESDDKIAGTILDEMEGAAKEKNPYTTIVTNSYDVVHRALSDHERYGCEDSFFLLRNNSDNCSLVQDPASGKPTIQEEGNEEIQRIIYPKKDRLINGLPLPLSAKFARFINIPYSRR